MATETERRERLREQLSPLVDYRYKTRNHVAEILEKVYTELPSRFESRARMANHWLNQNPIWRPKKHPKLRPWMNEEFTEATILGFKLFKTGLDAYQELVDADTSLDGPMPAGFNTIIGSLENSALPALKEEGIYDRKHIPFLVGNKQHRDQDTVLFILELEKALALLNDWDNTPLG